MLKKVTTEIVFAIAGISGLLSIAAMLTWGLATIPFAVLVHGLLIWTLVKSETEGFFKGRGMPRAGDPPREFHPLQSFILFAIALAQVSVSAYLVLTL
ncbi:MAG: hypothetical protein WBW88_10485 [Rhodothermales bacterium]|jgi:hypothetical protein